MGPSGINVTVIVLVSLYSVLPDLRFVCSIIMPESPTPHDASPKEEGALYSTEIFWRDRQPWLKEQGYTLRARYHPDWVPSWKQHPRKPRYRCEDGIGSGVRRLNSSSGTMLTRSVDI